MLYLQGVIVVVAMYSAPPEYSIWICFPRGMCCRECQDIESIAPEVSGRICLDSVLMATVLSDITPAAAGLILESEGSRHLHLPQTLP